MVANQVAIIVIRNLLRGGSGNEDAYTKAFTWFVLPHGLLAVSIATTFLPELSSAIKRGDRQKVLDRSSQGIRLIALVTLPAGFGLFVLRRAIVGAAFQHGKFTSANALNTSRALAGLRARPRRVLDLSVRAPRVLRAPGRANAVHHQRG